MRLDGYPPSHRNVDDPQPEVCEWSGIIVGGRHLLTADVEGVRGFRISDATKFLASARQRLAYRDDLTGLLNHRAFEERCAQELSRAERAGQPVSVIVFDLDGFKQINDEGGHQKGDEVLRWFGAFLQNSARSMDIVCRIGGDEFALIFPETDAFEARTLVERLRERLWEASDIPKLPGGGRVQFSSGIATYPRQGLDTEDLVAKADAEMYDDKRAHKAMSALDASAHTLTARLLRPVGQQAEGLESKR